MQNRRDWLKAALTLTAGLPLGATLSQRLMAAPMSELERMLWERPSLSPIKIRLNANENPYGPSDKAKQAIQQAMSESNRYAFASQEELKAMIAEKEGVTPEHIGIGAGSGDLLCQAGVAFGVEGGKILSAFPTFPLLMNYANEFNATWDKVNLNEKLEHDYEALASRVTTDTKLVFICNPNNPTGTLVDPKKVKQFCETVSKKVTVFVDEAYLEFLEPEQQVSMVDLVKKNENVVVSKTFSKIYGLAGLRIGYIIGKPETITKIARYHMGISNNQPAIAAAKASLGDESFMERCRKKNAEARGHLTTYLDKKGIWYGKSYTNFLFFPAKSNASQVLNELWERGIGIRVWDYNNQQWYRVSIGTLEEMKAFTNAFDKIA
ncbi:MAG: histidinol-phosphate transaminase [Cyclobacteriaceae bacterium]|nr:histidinol-phosphate transaminase [Cyclobacteriaceae bacterium]